ncbi:hypothetical protein [Pseudothermotoga sp.]
METVKGMKAFAGKCSLSKFPKEMQRKFVRYFLSVDLYRLIEEDHFALCLAVSRMAWWVGVSGSLQFGVCDV